MGLRGLLNKFSKVAGYKVNIQRYVALLYTNGEESERECKQTISFKIALKILRNIPH